MSSNVFGCPQSTNCPQSFQVSLSGHSGEEQQINHDPIRSLLEPSFALLHQPLKGGGDAIQARDMNPRRKDKNRAFTLVSQKRASNSGFYGLLGSMVDSRCEGTKPLSHPAMVARGGRMYGEGRAAVVPDQMSLLRLLSSGDWQVATRSTGDHPGGPGGLISMTVYVSETGYVVGQGWQWAGGIA